MDACLGWRGVCIEPVKSLHGMLRRERACRIEGVCISDREREVDFDGFGGDRSELSHISDGDSAGGLARPTMGAVPSTSRLKCETLGRVLPDALTQISYLSLDVEGHELQLLT